MKVRFEFAGDFPGKGKEFERIHFRRTIAMPAVPGVGEMVSLLPDELLWLRVGAVFWLSLDPKRKADVYIQLVYADGKEPRAFNPYQVASFKALGWEAGRAFES